MFIPDYAKVNLRSLEEIKDANSKLSDQELFWLQYKSQVLDVTVDQPLGYDI